MFIHVGYSHLIGNIVVQLILGLPLELVHKLWRVSLLYALGAITGSVLGKFQKESGLQSTSKVTYSVFGLKYKKGSLNLPPS